MTDKHTSESIMAVARGFSPSRVLLSGAELDLFTLLEHKAMTAVEIAEARNANLRGMTVLLDALSALGYLVKEDDLYQAEPSAAIRLSANSPRSLLPAVLHSAHLWKTWSDITGIVLDEVKPGFREKGALTPDHFKAFIGAMHVAGARTAPEVVEAADPGTARSLIDVGGGSGTYTLAFLKAVPEMRATLFDLPPVIEMARNRVGEAELEDRVTLVPGDFYRDELPGGHDLALLSAIIHQNSLQQNEALYRKVLSALEPGGRILIRDFVMAPDRTRPVEGAMFAINMLVGTPGGGTYTFEDIKQGLEAAGFERAALIRARGMFSLVEAFKPV